MKRTKPLTTSLLSLLAIVGAGAVTACGSTSPAGNSVNNAPPATAQGNTTTSAHSNGSGAAGGTSTRNAVSWPTVHAQAMHALPVGMLGNALAVDPGGQPISVGGYTGAVSLTGVIRIDGTTSISTVANLPQRTHDAATGFIGPSLYVFGGGQNASYNSITQVSQGGTTSAGTLPDLLSDATAVPYTWHSQSGVLIVGGYNGQAFNRTVRFATVQNGKFSLTSVFQLPIGLRYTAVTTIAGKVVMAGGLMPSGSLSSAVYMWTPGGSVKKLASLPNVLQKAAAFAAGNRFVLVAGGLNTGGQPGAGIYGIDIKTGQVKLVGHLPHPLAGMGYAQTGSVGYLAGGMTTASESSATRAVWKLQF